MKKATSLRKTQAVHLRRKHGVGVEPAVAKHGLLYSVLKSRHTAEKGRAGPFTRLCREWGCAEHKYTKILVVKLSPPLT